LLVNDFTEVWDKELEIWATNTQEIYTYNSSDKLTDRLFQSWNNTTNDWVNYKIFSFSYDDNGKMIEELWKDWNIDEEAWIMFLSFSYTYDADEFLIEELRQYWEEESNQWMPQYKNLFSNDEAGNVVERLKKYWEDIDSTWYNGDNYFYYYSDHQTTKIVANTENHNIVVYPNPSNSSIYILNVALLEFELTLFSSSGQKIATKKIKNKQEYLDLMHLQKGIYFLHFYSKEKGQFIEKIIKN
jgi:hypothetical protein